MIIKSIKAGALTEALSLLARVIPARVFDTIHETALLKGWAEGVIITITDGSTWLTASVPCEVEDPAADAVFAKPFLDYIKNLPADAQVRLASNYPMGKMTLQWAAGNADFPTINPADCPATAAVEAEEVIQSRDASVLARAIALCLPSVNTAGASALRPQLQGVHLHWHDGVLDAVATDSKELIIVTMSLPEGTGTPESGAFTIPKAEAALLRAVLDKGGDYTVHTDGRRLAVGTGEGYEINIRLETGKFPEYAKVVPSEGTQAELSSPSQALRCIKTALAAGGQGNPLCAMQCDPGMDIVLQCEGAAGKKGTQTLEGVTWTGAPLRIGFDAQRLSTLISRVGGERVQMLLSGERSPALITPAQQKEGFGIRAVLMPFALR